MFKEGGKHDPEIYRMKDTNKPNTFYHSTCDRTNKRKQHTPKTPLEVQALAKSFQVAFGQEPCWAPEKSHFCVSTECRKA